MTKKQTRTVFDVPSFKLRKLSYDEFLGSSEFIPAIELHCDLQELSMIAKRIDTSRDGRSAVLNYVVTAYATALSWEERGEATALILGATLVKDRFAFREEIDLFTATLKLGIVGTERPFSLSRSVDACKFAWLNNWDSGQFEYELLCDGISELANRWAEAVSSVAKPNASPRGRGIGVVAAT